MESTVPDGFEVKSLRVPGLAANNVTAIPLILPNDHHYDARTGVVSKRTGVVRDRLDVVPEAIAMLRSIRDPVSVLGICGPARTGKSYVLSRVLGRADAFDLGHSFEPKTFGIWIGTHVLKGQDKNGKDFCIILLDTEGIGAVSASQDKDAGIFVLTILLCSQLVYNSTNVPYQHDLDKLECFSRLASSIRVRQGQALDVQDSHYFPNFLWLLRDVSLITPDGPSGEPMDPTEYIKTKVFKRSKKIRKSKQEETAEAIMALFPEIEAFTLPPPHHDVSIMQNIAAFTDELSSDFNVGVLQLVQKLVDKCREHLKKGYDDLSVLTGQTLALLVEEYTAAINDPTAIPVLKSTWDNVKDRVIRETNEKLRHEYIRQMIALTKAASNADEMYPLEVFQDQAKGGEECLMGIHHSVASCVTREFRTTLESFGLQNGEGGDMEKCLEEFQLMLVDTRIDIYHDGEDTCMHEEICGGLLQRFLEENYQLSETYCSGLYRRLFDGRIKQNMEHDSENYSMENLQDDMDWLNLEYIERARGPAKHAVHTQLNQEIALTNLKDFEKVKAYQEEMWKAQQAVMLKEIEAMEKEEEMKRVREEHRMLQLEHERRLVDMENSFISRIREMKEEERERRDRERKRMEDAQAAEYRELVSKMREDQQRQRQMMQRQVDKLQRQLEDTTAKLNSLR